jgi:hypothetical protein
MTDFLVVMSILSGEKERFTDPSASHESRHNSVSLNKGYISSNTLDIHNYDTTPDINIINNTREDRYIVYTTLSNQDNTRNRNIVANSNKLNTALFKLGKVKVKLSPCLTN